MNLRNAAFLLLCLVAAAAQAQQTQPLAMKPLFQLNPTSAADRESQTRHFPGTDVDLVLEASAAVLQDMGYSIRGGDRGAGLLFAQKTAPVESAGTGHAIAEAGLVTVTVLASLLVGQDMVMDLPEQVSQRVYITLLVSAAAETQGSVRVRLSIDRDMTYDNGQVIADHTELPRVNEDFFSKLGKSVFLEGESL
jgi:glucose/arabinose dehydrogenase